MKFCAELWCLFLCLGCSKHQEWSLPSKAIAFKHFNNWKYLLCTGLEHFLASNRTNFCWSFRLQMSFKDPVLHVVFSWPLSFLVLGLRRSPGVAVSCERVWPHNYSCESPAHHD